MDRIQMSATPKPSSVLGSKQAIDEASVSDEIRELDVLRKDIMTVLAMNRDLETFKKKNQKKKKK
jgi:hypothetical protein